VQCHALRKRDLVQCQKRPSTHYARLRVCVCVKAFSIAEDVKAFSVAALTTPMCVCVYVIYIYIYIYIYRRSSWLRLLRRLPAHTKKKYSLSRAFYVVNILGY
jgi:cytosine/uracil/thiamine/allantoin permease